MIFDSGLWDDADSLAKPLSLEDTAEQGFAFAAIPDELTVAKNFTSWQRKLVDALYRTETLEVFKCTALKEYSKAGEAEDDFRIRLVQRLHEERDDEVEQLRDRYAEKMHSLDGRIRRAQDQVRRAEAEYRHETVDTAISIGKSIFGALFSRKKLSRTNVDRASSSRARPAAWHVRKATCNVQKTTSTPCCGNGWTWTTKSLGISPPSKPSTNQTACN